MGVLAAVSGGVIALIVILAVAFLALVAIVVGPSRRVRAEPPLDPDIEAAILLGEDPDEIEREKAASSDRSPIDGFPAESDADEPETGAGQA